MNASHPNMMTRLAGRVSAPLRSRLLGFVLLLPLLFSPDALKLNAAERAAAPYLYDLVQWEMANFPRKWLHRLTSIAPWSAHGDGDIEAAVREYFAITEQISRLKARLADSAAGRTPPPCRIPPGRSPNWMDSYRDDRASVTMSRRRLNRRSAPWCERNGSPPWSAFVFPPVDVRLTDPPKLLVTSPRDRIQRTHDVLLDADIRLAERERIENRLLDEDDLAGLVTNLGGVATYPASIPSGYSLSATLEISAHEWLHHYLFFRPLGQNIYRSPEMRTLNETVADIAGREIGRRAYERITGESLPEPSSAHPDHGAGEHRFDFRAEMHSTRLRVDELLAGGLIEQAEAYMEERRQLFVEHGFSIRKLNQAYFAFHGTYAESPASISPIAGELGELREMAGDLKSFIDYVSGVSSYPEFRAMLDDLRASP